MLGASIVEQFLKKECYEPEYKILEERIAALTQDLERNRFGDQEIVRHKKELAKIGQRKAFDGHEIPGILQLLGSRREGDMKEAGQLLLKHKFTLVLLSDEKVALKIENFLALALKKGGFQHCEVDLLSIKGVYAAFPSGSPAFFREADDAYTLSIPTYIYWTEALSWQIDLSKIASVIDRKELAQPLFEHIVQVEKAAINELILRWNVYEEDSLEKFYWAVYQGLANFSVEFEGQGRSHSFVEARYLRIRKICSPIEGGGAIACYFYGEKNSLLEQRWKRFILADLAVLSIESRAQEESMRKMQFFHEGVRAWHYKEALDYFGGIFPEFGPKKIYSIALCLEIALLKNVFLGSFSHPDFLEVNSYEADIALERIYDYNIFQDHGKERVGWLEIALKEADSQLRKAIENAEVSVEQASSSFAKHKERWEKDFPEALTILTDKLIQKVNTFNNEGSQEKTIFTEFWKAVAHFFSWLLGFFYIK